VSGFCGVKADGASTSYLADALWNTLRGSQPQRQAATNMGDKSPKAKDKAKKQDSAAKNQKKTDASNKANAAAASSKKTK
jgi:hypothetical protein